MQKKRNIIPLVETYNEVDTEKYIKSYMFIKGFASSKKSEADADCASSGKTFP